MSSKSSWRDFFSFYLEYKMFYSSNVAESFVGFTCAWTSVLSGWLMPVWLYSSYISVVGTWKSPFTLSVLFFTLFHDYLTVVLAKLRLRVLVSRVDATFHFFVSLHQYFGKARTKIRQAAKATCHFYPDLSTLGFWTAKCQGKRGVR